jgi:hypothetical protein
MGLSIRIHASAPASLGIAEIDGIVSRWHKHACAFADAGRLARVFDISGELDDLTRFGSHWLSVPHPDFPDAITGIAVPPIEGRMFLARVGEGCEPLVLGLCRYPGSAPNPKGRRKHMPTGVGEGWHFQSSCKTQYAGIQGWEHFKCCHTAAVELAAAAGSLGVNIRIDDEGGWWPARSETALRETLRRYDRIMAGFAGALKDELDNDTQPHGDGRHIPLQAAIFKHPSFEYLEPEGQIGDDGEKIQQALRKIRDGLK